MKQIAIISGKGGTGKTTIAGAFASLAQDMVIADCDVDAANLHLTMKPSALSTEPFYSGNTYVIDQKKCNLCGVCKKVCQFQAISPNFAINPISCEGCGICELSCPQNAIQSSPAMIGTIYRSEAEKQPFIYAELGAGEDNSGKLVTEIRKLARDLAEEKQLPGVLIDGPPGIGCPVNAAITGIDLAIIVTEPSVSGLHDLTRIIDLLELLKIESMVIINKATISPEMSAQITELLEKRQIKLLGTLPHAIEFRTALQAGQTILAAHPDSESAKQIREFWKSILNSF